MRKKFIIGVIAGFLSGLFASGGGLILIPAFTYFLKMDEKEARADSIFCILPMVITTAIFYFNHDLIPWNISIQCAIGGIIGGAIGAKLMERIKVKYLKLIFILFLLYAGISMIIQR